MMKKTHMATGVLVTTCLLSYTSLTPLYVVTGAIGSIAPDWDFVFGHRKITHSLLGVCIAFGLCYFINPVFAVVFTLNCLIHIVMDSFTKMGVPLFYPYNKEYYGVKEIYSSKSEDMFLCIIIIYLLTEMIAKI